MDSGSKAVSRRWQGLDSLRRDTGRLIDSGLLKRFPTGGGSTTFRRRRVVGIWTNSGDGWELDAPQPFQDEATLHHLILENPNLLPLAGSPRLTVLGSQVRLGNGYADILAVEPTGRPAIIEVKLAKNPEARKEIVSQILAYAAFLQGMSVQSLEKSLLRKGSEVASSGSILGAVQKRDQEGAVDADTFTGSLQNYLDQGNFRLVLVLDVVSAELQKNRGLPRQYNRPCPNDRCNCPQHL